MQKGFQLIDEELQENTKMTLQTRLALDLLLAKEQGLCRYHKLDHEHCCIHIPNVTDDLQKQLKKVRQVAEDSKGIRDTAENNWLNKIFLTKCRRMVTKRMASYSDRRDNVINSDRNSCCLYRVCQKNN